MTYWQRLRVVSLVGLAGVLLLLLLAAAQGEPPAAPTSAPATNIEVGF